MITTKLCVCVAILLFVVSIKNNAEATLNDACTDTSNCAAPSEQCTSGTCSCSSDYYENGGVCSQKVDLGSSCSSTSECKAVDASCTDSTCQCSEEFYWTDSGICEQINLGSACNNTSECKAVNASCTESTCQCLEEFYTTDSGICKQKIDLGTSCNNTSECKATNASCTNSICQCLDDFYPTDSGTCEQKLDFDADCQVSPTVQQCKTPFLCANTVTTAKCLCANGLYHDGFGNCQSVNNLKPTFEIRSSDLNTITIRLLNKPIVPPQYTSSSYKANISPGSLTQAVNENGDAVLVGLASGTRYNITITRTIVIYGWSKDTSPSDPQSFRTKGRFTEGCSNATDCKTEGVNPFVCQDSRCLCAAGFYYNGALCQDINALRPTFAISSDLNTITISLLNKPTILSQYTSSYTANISPEGSTQAVNENGDTVIRGLAEGTEHSITITRTIVIYGRSKTISPTDPQSISTKIRYGQPCTSNDTCVNTNADCYGDKCLCKVDYYWNNEATNCNSTSELRPTGVTTESVTTNSVVITWTPPWPVYISYISGYRVHVRPVNTSDPDPGPVPVSETSKNIADLQPGTEYRAMVSSRSDNDGRTQFVPASTPVTVITVPATVPGLDRDKSNFSSPSMVIGFQQADGKVLRYQVNLKGDNYDETLPANAVLRTATFFEIIAGRSYTVTILTYSNNIASAPFTEMVKAFAKPGPARDLHEDNTNSRDALVTWRKPEIPNGQLFQYSLEIAEDNSPNVCLFRVLIVCPECRGDNVTFTDLTNCDGVKETLIITEANIMNDSYIVSYKVTGLKPDTSYVVTVAAYNQESRGHPDTDKFATKIEAAGPPTDLKATPITSSAVTLKWKPPVPRPGNTFYNVSAFERNEGDTGFHFKSSQFIDGYENDTTTFEELSSYWYYKFDIYAATAVLPDSDPIDITVRTEESAPIEVESLVIQGVPNKYNVVQVSWRCPKQKDGRNGQITGASLKYQVKDQTTENTEAGDDLYPNQDNCVWNQMVTVTPEFNYTFTVYLRNSFDGARSTKHRYIPAGRPYLNEGILSPTNVINDDHTSVLIDICTRCLLDPQNGKIITSGLLVCVVGHCPKRDTAVQSEHYESFANWNTAEGEGFVSWYRATDHNWIEDSSDTISFNIGGDTCTVEDQNRYCNGPLMPGNQYRVAAFACTEVGCTESQYIEISTISNGLSPGAIAGIAVAVVVILVILVVAVVYIKVIRRRPHQSSEEVKYETYDVPNDVGDETVRTQEARDSSHEYAELSTYENTDQHDYGRLGRRT